MTSNLANAIFKMHTIDWRAAHLAVGAAAQAMGTSVNVAVVDASGVLAAFLRMPSAPLHSVDIAIDKAYTAVSFGLPTHQWADALQSHSAAVREGIVRRPRFVNVSPSASARALRARCTLLLR